MYDPASWNATAEATRAKLAEKTSLEFTSVCIDTAEGTFRAELLTHGPCCMGRKSRSSMDAGSYAMGSSSPPPSRVPEAGGPDLGSLPMNVLEDAKGEYAGDSPRRERW